MLPSSCYLRATLLLLPEGSHSVTLTVLLISDRHTFMPLVYIYSLNPENNPMKKYYYCPHIKDEETRELSVCVICQGHTAINSRAGIQCHEPWLLLTEVLKILELSFHLCSLPMAFTLTETLKLETCTEPEQLCGWSVSWRD